jgi:hypothetical protein
MTLAVEGILTADSKFDPTTPFGTWDDVADEYENTTDKVIFNLEAMTLRYVIYHNGYSASPTPISGDMVARYKDGDRGKAPRAPKMK